MNELILYKSVEILLTQPISYMTILLCIEKKVSKHCVFLQSLLGILCSILLTIFVLSYSDSIIMLNYLAPLVLVIPSAIALGHISKYINLQFIFIYISVCILSVITSVFGGIISFWIADNRLSVQIGIRIILLLINLYVTKLYFSESLCYFHSVYEKECNFTILYPMLILVLWGAHSIAPTRFTQIDRKVIIPYLSYMDPLDLPTYFLVLICIVGGFIFIAYLYRVYYKYLVEKRNKQLLDIQMHVLENQCLLYNEKEMSLRIIRHDFRHTVNVISTLIKDNKNEAALEYLDKLGYRLSDTKINTFCDNPILNATISIYLSRANELEIPCKLDLHIPSTLMIDSRDLSLVLSNALDNAIHACEKVPVEKRFLSFIFRSSTDQIVFEITNPYTGYISLDQKGKPTSLSEHHGFGTKSILNFEEKYNAIIDYDISNEVFKIRVLAANM